MQNLSLSGREAEASLIWSFGLKGVWRFGGAAIFAGTGAGVNRGRAHILSVIWSPK
jgi:hypothetical protein